MQCILQSERCNPNITNSEGCTPLHVAVKNGDFENTLHMAASETSLSYVGFFLNYKSIDLNIQNREGNTPLHEAVIRKVPINVVEGLVLHKSCNPSTENSTGMTPLQISSDIEKLDYANVLITSGKCSLEDILKVTEGTPLLHKAVSPYRPKLIATLLNVKEFHVNRTNSAGETALHVACNMKDIKAILVVETLVEDSRCDLNAQNQSGNIALHLALCSEQQVAKKVQCIVQRDRCNPNITNSEGYTPLHVAVKERDFESAMIILNHSQCNPNIQDLTDNTPLHIAISEMSLSNVESFLNHKSIDLNIQNREGNTVLHKAVLRQTPVNIVEALTLNKTCNPNYEGLSSPQISAVVSKLVEDSRCDLNVQDQHGNTALHLAVYSGTDVAEKVQCILQSERCNPNITNSEGYTPLHVAVCKMEFDACVIILKHSQCDPSIQDIAGDTPLHLSISKMDVDVVKALTHHKSCSPSIANDAQKTPLQSAIDLRKMGHVEVLITSGKCSHEDIEMAIKGKCLPRQALDLQQVNLFLALIKLPECDTINNGETLLHVACRARYYKTILESIVENSRCDLNTQNESGDTALHIAVASGSHNVEKVECILQSERCNPNITNCKGFTPLHVAVENKQFQSAAMLLKHSDCNPNIQDLSGNTPLHLSIDNKPLLNVVEVFLLHKYIDLSIQNNSGDTVLHIAVLRKISLEVVAALILHKSCNLCITNSKGMTPLQTAVSSREIDVAAALITSKKCSHEDIAKATEDAGLLICAVLQEKAQLLTALIEAGINVNATNSKGETALHIACKKGNSEATELLLRNGADILAVDHKGNAPIHVACENTTLECLNVLLSHHACNPNQQNAVGDTPLHFLCTYEVSGDMTMLRTLLSIPGIDPKCANHAGQTPAELALYNYFVIEEISKYLKRKNAQLEAYLKIFVVGNSGGGKSTLIKAVTSEKRKSWKPVLKTKHVKPSEVPSHTAGIVPHRFNSQHFGHAVLYDFAGQHEYYSSHAAVMENLVVPSPPLFLLLIDISKPMDEIREELVYWWMFINNHSKRTTTPPHVILVGSHEDIVKERGGSVQETMEQITDIVKDIPVSFQFDHSKAFSLDCRKLVSQGLTALLTQLKLTCQTLRQNADVDLHCHILKAFLTTNFQSSIACEVSEIAEWTKLEDVLLPQESFRLIPLLSTLSDKGYILLLEDHTDVNKSWVVLKPEVLLTEVNGSIFAPENFKGQYNGFAMSTGVVPLSKIRQRFGEPNNQVIIKYLTHLEFCFQIKDQHTLEMITKDATLQLTTHGSEHVEEYYFFPALIWRKNPSDVCQPQETIKYECGWFYRCNKPTEQLTTRFLHVLILRLAFSCDPPDEPTERESVVLLRSCSVWKHGIAWWTNDGIETIVEVGLQCRWVAVMLRCPDTHKVQCAELRTKVISTVLKTKQDFCPAINMKEFLISPSSLQYPFDGRALTLYSMREIAKIIIADKEFPKDTEGKSTIHISQLLPFEPFFNFGEDLLDNLFTPDPSRESEILRHNMYQIANKCYKMLDDFMEALQPNPTAFQRECVKPDCTEVDRCVALFQIIQRRGCKTWRDFEHEFSRFSVFCGRSPMVSQNLML